MKYFKSTGFILKRSNFGEADRLVTIFTRSYGKIKCLAKGVRKISSRRVSHLEIFNKVKVNLYNGKTFSYISEVETIKFFSLFRDSLPKIAIAYQMCELVDKLCPQEQKQEDIYFLLEKGFDYLDRTNGHLTKKHLDMLVNRFTARMLISSGFIAQDSPVDPQEYTQSLLNHRLFTPKFLSQTQDM